jgi:hypothetical protein
MKYFTTILSLVALLHCTAYGQQLQPIQIPVEVNGKMLDLAFAGGLNAPQFYKFDLNRDGLEDYFVFDRSGNIPLAFAQQPNGKFELAPGLLSNFPRMVEWVVMIDYNGDGIPDLFTYSIELTSSIRVFKGRWVGNQLTFDPIIWLDQQEGKQDVLHIHNRNSNVKTNNEMYIFNVDIPAIVDVDGDGDLDILTFESAGFVLGYFQNRSVELGFGKDSLIFVLEDDCWGGFWESGVTPTLDLSPAIGQCARPGNWDDPDENDRELRHAGSSITAFDITGNGLLDLLLGDISFNALVMAENGGNAAKAWIVDQDTAFPSYDTSVDIPYFPAAFHLDVDNDGKKDLLVAPNYYNTLEDTQVGWFYKNIAEDDGFQAQLVQKDFLVGDMIDVGKGSIPAFFDYNGDGLMDIVVGMYDFYRGVDSLSSKLVLFENVGTATTPAYKLVDDNYLNFQRFNPSPGAFEFAPFFADMDGDGDADLIVGEFSGRFYYAENKGGAGNVAVFDEIVYPWMNLQLESSPVPFVFDWNEDGLPDILIGDRRGEVRLFINQGTAEAPVFDPNVNNDPNIRRLGQVTGRGPGSFLGNSAPAVVYENGVKRILLGTNTENIHSYIVPSESNNLTQFTRILSDEVTDLRLGHRTRMAFADITNDGYLEMLVGNFRGGLSLYSTRFRDDNTTVSTVNKPDLSLNWEVFPNPIAEQLNLQFIHNTNLTSGPVELKVFNTIGQVVQRQSLPQLSDISIPVSHWAPGVYIIQIAYLGQSSSKMVVKR